MEGAEYGPWILVAKRKPRPLTKKPIIPPGKGPIAAPVVPKSNTKAGPTLTKKAGMISAKGKENTPPSGLPVIGPSPLDSTAKPNSGHLTLSTEKLPLSSDCLNLEQRTPAPSLSRSGKQSELLPPGVPHNPSSSPPCHHLSPSRTSTPPASPSASPSTPPNPLGNDLIFGQFQHPSRGSRGVEPALDSGSDLGLLCKGSFLPSSSEVAGVHSVESNSCPRDLRSGNEVGMEEPQALSPAPKRLRSVSPRRGKDGRNHSPLHCSQRRQAELVVDRPPSPTSSPRERDLRSLALGRIPPRCQNSLVQTDADPSGNIETSFSSHVEFTGREPEDYGCPSGEGSKQSPPGYEKPSVGALDAVWDD